MIDPRRARSGRQLLCLLGLACAAWSGFCAEPSASAASLSVQGVKPDTVRYSLADLRALPLRKLRVEFAPGRSAECEGVQLADILTKSGLAMGKALRGARLSEYLLVTARDGYAVVFALTELDPEFTDTPAVLCLALDGAPIPDESGPLRLVVPQEKRHARWVRQVVGLTLKKAL